jgi:hypothetical protein
LEMSDHLTLDLTLNMALQSESSPQVESSAPGDSVSEQAR